MLRMALTFFIFSIVAAVLGFGGIANASAGAAQTLFYVFVVLFTISAVLGVIKNNDECMN